jgi:hypothetical protein
MLDDRELNADEIRNSLTGYLTVKKAVTEQGLGKGKPGQGTTPCGACATGVVSFSVAADGDIWAKCSTEGCVAFIE